MPMPKRESCKRVLVAVDDSVRAPEVVAAAMDMARGMGASVRLFHAISIPPVFPPAGHVEDDDPLPKYLRREATRRLEELGACSDGVPTDILVEEAQTPWRAILAAADHYEADLIVVGSHGYTTLDRVLGTTAAKVVDHSPRSVFVVHRQIHEGPV